MGGQTGGGKGQNIHYYCKPQGLLFLSRFIPESRSKPPNQSTLFMVYVVYAICKRLELDD